jgi:hypothetical protein
MNADMTGWETQPGMVQKLVETGVRCQAATSESKNQYRVPENLFLNTYCFNTLLASAAAISASASFCSRNFCATELAAAFLTATT